jgi:hypothetical protein
MKITLSHLQKKWDKSRIWKIKTLGFVIGSDKLFDIPKYPSIKLIDAIWSDDHDGSVEKRNSNKIFDHIFISRICDIAVEEYATVCKLLNVKRNNPYRK